MKKVLLSVFSVLLVTLGIMITQGEALTFNLNCVISGTGCAPSLASFGTVTLTDNGNGVDILVDLVGWGTHKALAVYLNYNDSLFSNSDRFRTTSSVTEIKADENSYKADGYSDGYFDLRIRKTGQLGFEPYSDTITLPSFNLNPEHFNFTDTSNLLYAAVHIGNYDGSPGVGGEDSIWVGSRDSAPVPEPTSLLLLGSGLVGLGFWRRKSITC